jgi:rhodanese-related sulfurtransferase/CBS domain-containing protein
MAEQAPKETDREGVRVLTRRGAQLVDVLPRLEYDQIHLAGAVNIPLGMISRRTADQLKWDRPVIVYSRDATCDLSARAAWRLAALGFTQVYRYTAGRADWLANGLFVEGAEALTPGAGDLADMDVPTCKRSERVGDVRRNVQPDGWNVCVVVNDELVVLGMLDENDLTKADPQWTTEEAMQRDPHTFRLNASTDEVRAFFDTHPGVNYALVTTSDGRLYGLLKRSA